MNIADNPEVEGKKDVELKNWYYVSKGNRLGPVSENEIRVLIELDEIFPSTNVWRQGLQNWAELNQTELSIMFEYSPPPLLKEEINNSYVWILVVRQS